MKPIRRSHVHLLILAIFVTVFVAALYGYMKTQISKSVDRSVTARQVINVEETNKKKTNDVIVSYKSTADDRARLQSYFLSSDQAIALIETLEGLGKQAGSVVTLSGINSEPPPPKDPLSPGKIKAHIEAKGPWPSVMRTLALTETLPFKINIDRVNLSGSGIVENEKAVKNWSLSFDLEVAIMGSAADVVAPTPTKK